MNSLNYPGSPGSGQGVETLLVGAVPLEMKAGFDV
jgi:hypothetical protein